MMSIGLTGVFFKSARAASSFSLLTLMCGQVGSVCVCILHIEGKGGHQVFRSISSILLSLDGISH